MNSEYAIETLKSNLTTYMESVLTTIQHEANSTRIALVPTEYKIGEHDPNILTMYPNIQIWSPYSRKSKDSFGFQLRTITIRTLAWIVENDLDNLHIYIVRYGDAIGRIFRNETYWDAKSFINPVVEDINNTDLYKQDAVGYAQGVLIEGTIDYLLV